MLEMDSTERMRALCGLAIMLAPLAGGCASTQYQAALSEREEDNRALREERTQLKGEMRDLRFQKDSLETALAEANARLLLEPDSGAVAGDPELDALGIGHGLRDGNMVYTVPTEVTFASGKADLSSGGKKALQAVADRLERDYPENEYWVEGHTDSDPIKKSAFKSNRELSLARAMAVLHFLVDDAGLHDGQCVVAGWGEYRPVSGNDSAASKAKNRRVEIIVRQ